MPNTIPTMINKNNNVSLIVVLESLVVLFVAHLILSGYIFALLVKFFPYHFSVMLSTSIFSTLLANVYLFARAGFFPKMFNEKPNLGVFVVGVLSTFAITIIYPLIWSQENRIVTLINISPHKYANIFLFACWAPFIEELLYRGYFIEIIRRQKSAIAAVGFSSLVYALALALLSAIYSPEYLRVDLIKYLIVPTILLFMYSLAFSISYVKAGLLAAIIHHMLVNVLILYIYW